MTTLPRQPRRLIAALIVLAAASGCASYTSRRAHLEYCAKPLPAEAPTQQTIAETPIDDRAPTADAAPDDRR